MGEQRLGKGKIGASVKSVEVELRRYDELGLFRVEKLSTQLLFHTGFDEPWLLLDPQIVSPFEIRDEVDPAPETSTGDIEEIVVRFEALGDQEIELQAAYFLPHSPHVGAMPDLPYPGVTLPLLPEQKPADPITTGDVSCQLPQSPEHSKLLRSHEVLVCS